MSGARNDIDAGFFQLVHQLVRAPRSEESESRELARRQFECFQKIAPWDGQRFPEPSEFFVVRCNDLTRRGFSYQSPRKPAFDQIVAALVCPAQSIYLAAKVVRVVPITTQFGGGNRPSVDRPGRTESQPAPNMFLVGCRFTERLYRPEDRG